MTDENLQHEPSAELAASLRNLSRWDEQTPSLWQSALERSRPRRGWLFRRIPIGVTAAAAVLVLGAILSVALFSKNGMTQGVSSKRLAYGSAMEAQKRPSPARVPSPMASAPPSPKSDDYAKSYASLPFFGEKPDGRTADAVPKATEAAAQVAVDRQVIRKAYIELKAHDVRTAFLKAAQLLSEARGEYIEQSSLTGQDEHIQGSLTLRVAADHLSELLNQLRGLATVVSETSGGEDVTNQVVDLEARIRNEQRVETELLGLMEARKDAPLKDILELRDSIGRVRENIERMTAQRERLGRLVSLATVLVIINTDNAAPEPRPDGLGAYFVKQIKAAWQASMELLTDSVAFVIRLFVGGAFFWLLAILLLLGILAARRRWLRAGAAEPAPRLG
jgi:Domain of unknown function (DUF4349)